MTTPFSHPIIVRYHEVDMQGVVFNMWYLAYFDEAMGEFIEANDLAYTQLQQDGFDVQLVHIDVDWTDSLRFGEEASVTVEVASVGNASFALDFAVRQAGRSVCTSRIVYVCVALDGTGKQPLPPPLRRCLTTGSTTRT